MSAVEVLDPFASASDLVRMLSKRQISSRELLTHYLDRIAVINADLNAVVTIDAERALAEAGKADEATVRGISFGPLHGLPVTVKDAFETAGMRTTAGSPELADYFSASDAVSVQRFRAAGAIVFGKTNLPEYAGDSQTFNALFGTTNNPWDLSRTPGGSSGGSTAAIAAGLTALELGSDIGGSLRIPAHFCGVFTLKPTHGIVPLRGHIPPPPGSQTEALVLCAGPVARSAQDLDLSMSVIAGPGEAQSTAWRLELPPSRASSLSGYHIAAWLDDPYCSIDAEILEIYTNVVAELRSAGARIEERAGPVPLAEAHDIAQRLIQGATAQWFTDDHFRELLDRVEKASPGDLTPPVRWARNVTQRVRDYSVAIDHRVQLENHWAEFFRHFDALLCPVTPTAAIPHDQNPDVDARTILVNGTSRSYGDQYGWLQSVGVVHLPAAVAPVGQTSEGLPVGIQIVAPLFHDRTAIDLAGRVSEIMGGFQPPPNFVN